MKKRPAKRILTGVVKDFQKEKMENKVATTLSIDKDIKLAFKIECTRNGVEMSEQVEGFMEHYTEISIKLNAQQNAEK